MFSNQLRSCSSYCSSYFFQFSLICSMIAVDAENWACVCSILLISYSAE